MFFSIYTAGSSRPTCTSVHTWQLASSKIYWDCYRHQTVHEPQRQIPPHPQKPEETLSNNFLGWSCILPHIAMEEHTTDLLVRALVSNVYPKHFTVFTF